jgi:dTDP-6-deoxy-L-talose 4-dehydrogenase (NAD+)
MKILVTGASGGLGQLIITQLLDAGHTVVATSRNKIKAENLSFYEQVQYVAYDLSNASSQNLFELFHRPDALIHLAWDKLNEYKNEAHLTSILNQHKHFLQNLIINGLKDMTSVGTCYEYGLQEGELEESMASKPMMPYPESKNLLRIYLEELQLQFKFNLKWPRVFYVFGAIKERKNLYTLLVDAINRGDKSFNMSGGEQIRDFLSPDEIANLIVKIALQNKVQGIINCCSGQPIQLKDKIKQFLKENNYHIHLNLGHYPYPDYEPMQTWGSVEKLNKIE